MKVSRRGLLGLAGAGLVAAQPPADTTTPKPDPLTTAREDNRRGAERLSKFEISMSTEPAFTFRA
jgi:hypothetical protein